MQSSQFVQLTASPDVEFAAASNGVTSSARVYLIGQQSVYSEPQYQFGLLRSFMVELGSNRIEDYGCRRCQAPTASIQPLLAGRSPPQRRSPRQTIWLRKRLHGSDASPRRAHSPSTALCPEYPLFTLARRGTVPKFAEHFHSRINDFAMAFIVHAIEFRERID